jgi:hypothetical protein
VVVALILDLAKIFFSIIFLANALGSTLTGETASTGQFINLVFHFSASVNIGRKMNIFEEENFQISVSIEHFVGICRALELLLLNPLEFH